MSECRLGGLAPTVHTLPPHSDYLGLWATRGEDYLARVLVEEMEAASANTRRLLDEGKSLMESQFVLVVGELCDQRKVHPRVVQAFE